MTPEQFVFWLRGYLAAGGNVTQGGWKAVTEMLKHVQQIPAQRSFTDPTDADRRELRQKLEQEREAFVKSLPPTTLQQQWAPPEFTVRGLTTPKAPA